MSSEAERWLVGQLEQRGWMGLEAVAEYVATLSTSDECKEYLGSLLGPEADVEELAQGFCTRRDGSAGDSSAPTAMPAVEAFAQPSASKSTRRRQRPGRDGRATTVGEAGAAAAQLAENNDATRRRIRQLQQEKRVLNCLQCGKIHMEIPNDGKCSFCSHTLLDEVGQSSDAVRAEQHRDTLLRYDQTAAKRTVVLDDQ